MNPQKETPPSRNQENPLLSTLHSLLIPPVTTATTSPLQEGGEKPTKERQSKTEQDIQNALHKKLEEIAERYPNTIVSPQHSIFAKEFHDFIRKQLSLHEDTTVSFFPLLTASRSNDIRHQKQPWNAVGQFSLTIGSGDDRFVLEGRLTLVAGQAAEIEIKKTNWDNPNVQKMLRSQILEGTKSIFEVDGTVNEEKKMRIAKILLSPGDNANLHDGSRLQDEKSFLKDPALAQLTKVAEITGALANDVRFHTFDLRNEMEQAEASLWVTRWLHSRELQPSKATVTGALESLDKLRATLEDKPLFHGRNVVVAADGQLVIDLLRGNRRKEAAGVLESRGDSHVFGTSDFIKRLRTATGPDGNVKLFRAEEDIKAKLETVLVGLSLRGAIQNAACRDFEDREKIRIGERVLRDEFRSLFNVKDKDPLVVHAQRDPERAKVFTISIESGDVLLATLQFEEREESGKLLSHSLTKEGLALAPEEVNTRLAARRILDAIESNPPGKNGFLFIFDGHGNPDSLSLNTDAYTVGGHVSGKGFLSPKEIAAAIRNRSTRFDTSGDIYIFESCFSKDFLSEVAKELVDVKGAPILISSTEHGQKAAFSPHATTTSRTMSLLLRKGENHLSSTSLGDFFQLLLQSPTSLFSNPTLWIPRTDTQKKSRGYDQISQLPGGLTSAENV